MELPRITLADRPAIERAVNEQLDALAGDMMCAPDTPEESRSYDSSVKVAYADHEVFSVAILASFHCGGAHLVNGADLSVTFDLRTGRSVRLRELFEDYARDASAIADRYVATLSADEREGCEDVFPVERDRADGAAGTAEDSAALEEYGFTYTISPAGLVLRPAFPNVIAACAHPLTVPFVEVLEFASDDGILVRVAGTTRSS